MKFCCQMMQDNIRDKQIPLIYQRKYRQFGIEVMDGGTSYILIKYCPFCGKKLPSQLRDKWFKELEKLGIADPLVSKIPNKFNSDLWWKNKSL